MDDFEISALKRDKLYLLLSTARDEVWNFVDYHEKAEKIRNLLRKREEAPIGCLFSTMLFFVGLISFFLFWGLSDYKFSSIVWVHSVLFVVIVFLIVFFRRQTKKYYAIQLQEWQKKEKEAMDEFKAARYIPDDYCNEYALTTMMKYIDNQRADTWKEVTGLYEEHLHRITMENNASQIIEELKLQADYLRQTRNRTNFAAAGAWAAAAGIWQG